MQWRNSSTRYGIIATSLHWVIVAGIIAQYFLAEAAEDQENAAAGALSLGNLHTSLGLALLALAVVRLLWRFAESPPARPITMKRYEIAVARAVHVLFYVLLFALPISGWALATAEGEPLTFFGLFDVAQLGVGARLGFSEDQLEEVHEIVFNVLLALALLHLAAALKHQFVDRDGVLRSMLPWSKREQRL